MANDIFTMYSKLLEDDGNSFDPDLGMYTGLRQYQRSSSFDDDDDGETFTTSKEIAEAEKKKDPASQIAMRPDEWEEHLHFKRYTQAREHKYTEKEMEQIRESCKYCLVHDYSENDIYHISDEEKAEIDSLNEMAVKLSTLKKTYRQVDQYIQAMRIVVAAWELLEKKENFVHTDKEFWEMVADGRIYHNRIIMPQLKGMDKYNKELLIQYISNPELDPKDLIPQDQQQQNAWYDWDDEPKEDDETEEEELQRLLSPDEVQYILDHGDHPEEIHVKPLKRKEIKGYDRQGYRSFRKKRDNKKLSKKKKYLQNNLHDILKKIQNNPLNRNDEFRFNRSMMLTTSMFDPPKKIKDAFDDIRFDGSWTNKNDRFIYDLVIRERELEQYVPGNSAMTYADAEVADLFRAMEEQGMNVVSLRTRMNIDNTGNKKDIIRKRNKQNKKTESLLLQRIVKLNKNPKFKKLISKAEDKMAEAGD